MKRSQSLPLLAVLSCSAIASFYTSCGPSSTAGTLQAQPKAGSRFENGNVCGKVQARPDHELSEMPVTLTADGETRFVTLKGSAFDRLLRFVTAGEKTICLNADWADQEVPTLENFVLVSVPDFHGAEGGPFAHSAANNGFVCGKVQARPDHELSEMPVTITAGNETRFVNLKDSAFNRLLRLVSAGEKTICLRADWEKTQVPTILRFEDVRKVETR